MEKSIVIAVFCYKRAYKLKQCIEALLKNPECPLMDIIFFSDGYKNETDKAGVLETRDYINSVTGFKSVIKHFRTRNVSTGPNFKLGLTHLAAHYQQFIVVEDDLIVSPNYIKFLLDGLTFYKNEPSVFCITGFVYPVTTNNYPYDSIIYQRFCSYGWAGWADRFKNVIWDEQQLHKLMNTSKGFKKRLNAEGYDLVRMLKKQIAGKISTWDIQLQTHISENGLKVVYPSLSKVTNIGFDEESTNTFGVNWMITPMDDGRKRRFIFCPVNNIVKPLQTQIKKPFSLKELVKRKIINTYIKATKQVKKAEKIH